MQPASPTTQLDAALSATFHSRSYITTTKYIPEAGSFIDSDQYVIANAPNLLETMKDGIVSEIDVGGDSYSAVPAGCRTDAKFVEVEVPSIGYDQQIDFLHRLRLGRLFATDSVSQIGDTFSLGKGGKEIESFVVQDGNVIRQTNFLSAISGRRGLPDEVISFSDVDHAPKIVVPPSTEVVSPHGFTCGGRSTYDLEGG
jgi:hypothetical protein